MYMWNLLKLTGIDSEEGFNRRISKRLWGYPDLVEKFHDVLIESYEQGRREKEETKQQDTMTEHVDNVPEIMNQGKDDTASNLPQFIPPTHLDDESGHLDMTETGIRSDGHRQTYDPSPTVDVRTLLTTSKYTDALETASQDPIPQPELGEEIVSPNGIEEIPSTTETITKDRA